MRRHLALVILAILSLGLSLRAQSSAPQGAQSSETQSGQSDANPPRTMSPPIQISLTGCLKRGNVGGYRLTDQNGITWMLISKDVDLAEHLNHVVTVTGKPAPLPPQQQGADSQQSEGSNPAHGLRVLTVKMLSNSCTR